MFQGDGALTAGRSNGRGPQGPPPVASGVLAMLILVAAEVMFFAGLISAFLIAKTGAVGWPPLGQPRLPVGVTAVNSLVLLASGGLLWLAVRAFGRVAGTGGRLLAGAVLLGVAFVSIQGYEWARLIRYGLTLTSSTYGAFFYLIVGAHGLHAVAALVALGWANVRLRTGRLTEDAFAAVGIFWCFVVGVWPLLYVLVYLL